MRISRPSSLMWTGWFSPLHQNTSTHRFSTGNMRLRHECCDTSTPVTTPRWCFAGNAVKVFHLESSGTPLSLLQGSQFTSKAFQLETGDVFVAYTDGITETEGPGDESWGQKKLENLLRSAAIECQRKS